MQRMTNQHGNPPWSAALGCAVLLWVGTLRAAEPIVLEVQEISGLRRYYDPVSTLVELPRAVARGTHFRLLADGEPIDAQFRPADDRESTDQWWLDFATQLAPHQQRTYTIEYGGKVKSVPEPERGHMLRETEQAFVIENAPYITWTIPRDLRGLLSSVDFPPNEHLRPGAKGLVLEDRDGRLYELGGPDVQARVVRNGTMAIALAFSGELTSGSLAGVQWTVEMVFPLPVSWVELTCTLEDPQDRVAGMGTELNLALDAPKSETPTLVDIGAWTFAYAALRTDEVVEFTAERGKDQANPRCAIHRGLPEQLALVANNDVPKGAAHSDPTLSQHVEGWLHVMDRKRCLALAVDQFAQTADERFTVGADGSVKIWRNFDHVDKNSNAAAKTQRMWLHFVHYPPQYSAGTSPHMMQTQPTVRVKAR